MREGKARQPVCFKVPNWAALWVQAGDVGVGIGGRASGLCKPMRRGGQGAGTTERLGATGEARRNNPHAGLRRRHTRQVDMRSTWSRSALNMPPLLHNPPHWLAEDRLRRGHRGDIIHNRERKDLSSNDAHRRCAGNDRLGPRFTRGDWLRRPLLPCPMSQTYPRYVVWSS